MLLSWRPAESALPLRALELEPLHPAILQSIPAAGSAEQFPSAAGLSDALTTRLLGRPANHPSCKETQDMHTRRAKDAGQTGGRDPLRGGRPVAAIPAAAHRLRRTSRHAHRRADGARDAALHRRDEAAGRRAAGGEAAGGGPLHRRARAGGVQGHTHREQPRPVRLRGSDEKLCSALWAVSSSASPSVSCSVRCLWRRCRGLGVMRHRWASCDTMPTECGGGALKKLSMCPLWG